jgi:uncharacterized protein with beta-barrel porin domain
LKKVKTFKNFASSQKIYRVTGQPNSVRYHKPLKIKNDKELKMFKSLRYIIAGIFISSSFINAQVWIDGDDKGSSYDASSYLFPNNVINLGTINIINGGYFYVVDTMVNNGTINIDGSSYSFLVLINGESNGDDAIKGTGGLIFGDYSSATDFTINGENINFTPAEISITNNAQVTLNSAKGLGDYGKISFSDGHLILNIEGNQTFNKGLRSTSYNANINKTGGGELHFNASLGSVRTGSPLNVEQGSVYLDPDKSVYKFATIVNKGANVYFELSQNSTLASYMSGGGDITQSGNYTLEISADNKEFNGTYRLSEGGLVFADAALVNPKAIEFGANIIAGSNSYVGGFANINGSVTLKRDSALFAGDMSRARGYEFRARNILFEDGSRYEVYASNETSGIIAADKISIGSNVGVFVKADEILNNASLWHINSYYLIANASSSVTGTFSGVSTDLAFLEPQLRYVDNNKVVLQLKRNDVAFDALEGLTQNQASTAAAVESIGFYDSNNTLLTTAFGSSVSNAPKLFDSLSGEFYASSLGVQKQNANEIKNLLLNHINAEGNGTKYQDWLSVWSRDYKGNDGDYHDIDSNSYGVLAGFDSSSDDSLLGLSVGYEYTKNDINSLESKGKINTFYLSAYIAKSFDTFVVKGGILGGLSKIEADRRVEQFNDTLSAEYDSYTVQLFAEAGKEFEINDALKLSPYVGGSYLILNTEGFTEKGKDAALRVEGDSEEVGFVSVGLKSLYKLRDSISFAGSLGLEQAFGDTKGDSRQSFASNGDGFTIYGTPIAKTSAKLGLGADFKLSSDFLISASYEGAYAKEAKEHSAYVRLNYTF